MPQFRIVIVGAGIAGLSTAIALNRKGHDVTVVERHDQCQALGGPVGLSANATRVLIEYGMESIMSKRDTREHRSIYQRRYDNGVILGSTTGAQMKDTYGFPSWSFARYRLQEALAEVAEERGVKIRFSSTVVSVDQERPAVILKDGTEIVADLIVGADGYRSVVRDSIIGEQVKGISTFGAYNVDIPRSLLKADSSLSHLLEESNFWLGPSQVVAGLNMSDHGDKMNFCLISEESAGKEGEWYTLGDLKMVKAKFANFEPSIHKMLDLADPKDCYIWRFSEIPPLPRWVSKNSRVVIAGDSVHAMLPYANMGASQCIEDSACLAECIDRARSIEDLAKVLRAYETIRKPRVEWMARRGRQNAKIWHLPDGEQQQERDKRMGSKPVGIPDMKVWDGKNIDDPPEGNPYHPLALAYTNGYDIFDYTKRQLDQILGETLSQGYVSPDHL